MINHFTPEQISKYFDSNPTPQGWPEIKAGDKKSVVAGLGNNTKVKMAIKRSNRGSELVAVKKIYTPELSSRRTIESYRRRSLREICLQRRARCCAPAVYGIAERIDRKKKCHKIYLAMELIKAPRLESIYQSLTRQEKLTVACSLTGKLGSLHHRHIYVGDFKDSNVLIGPEDLQVTVIDFGSSHDLRDSIELNFNCYEICHYLAPEIYQASRYYCVTAGICKLPLPDPYPGTYKNRLLMPQKADIYSLGIVVAKMFSHCSGRRWSMLYADEHLTTTRFDRLTRRKMVAEQLDHDLVPLVTEMLQADPARRPDLSQVARSLKALAALPRAGAHSK